MALKTRDEADKQIAVICKEKNQTSPKEAEISGLVQYVKRR
jgi:hypothetical protein